METKFKTTNGEETRMCISEAIALGYARKMTKEAQKSKKAATINVYDATGKIIYKAMVLQLPEGCETQYWEKGKGWITCADGTTIEMDFDIEALDGCDALSEGGELFTPDTLTFGEYLSTCGDIDLELIIGGVESECAFVWYSGQMSFTEFGKTHYAAILSAQCNVLENGNIEVLCDDEELGTDFQLTIAGFCSDSFYKSVLTQS